MPTRTIDAVTIRPASPDDLDAAWRIMYDDPEPEIVAVCRSRALARGVGRVLIDEGIQASPSKTLIATVDGATAALMELWWPGEGLSIPPLSYARVLSRGVWMGGPGLIVRYFRFQRARARVDTPRPPESLYIAHLNTHPDWRGHGIGARLLAHAEQLACDAAIPQLALDVYLTNPARRLYERFGFETTAERRDAGFERMTGIPGYAAMTKRVEQAPATGA